MSTEHKPKIENFKISFVYKDCNTNYFIEKIINGINYSPEMIFHCYYLHYGNGSKFFNISLEKGNPINYRYNPKAELVHGSTEHSDTDDFWPEYGPEQQVGIITHPSAITEIKSIEISYERDSLNKCDVINDPQLPLIIYQNPNGDFNLKSPYDSNNLEEII